MTPICQRISGKTKAENVASPHRFEAMLLFHYNGGFAAYTSSEVYLLPSSRWRRYNILPILRHAVCRGRRPRRPVRERCCIISKLQENYKPPRRGEPWEPPKLISFASGNPDIARPFKNGVTNQKSTCFQVLFTIDPYFFLNIRSS